MLKITKQSRRGFSLMEILIVIVILGVLAGLAVPVYTTQVEKSRSAEALAMLQATRESMLRYFAEHGTYVGAGLPPLPLTIDFNPNLASGGQINHFSYAVAAPSPLVFKIYATRIDTPDAPLPPGGPHIISVKQNGSVDKSGIYA